MKSIYLTAACVAASLALGTGTGSAHEHGMKKKMSGHSGHQKKATLVRVENAWARATPGLAKNGGAYLTAVNGSNHADRIVGVSSEMAKRTELHTHIHDKGVMRMREVKGGIEVPAGGKVTFKPGGLHVMFIGLHKPLKKGQSFPVTLTFEKAGKRTFEVKVMGVGAMKGGMHHSSGHGKPHHDTPSHWKKTYSPKGHGAK